MVSMDYENYDSLDDDFNRFLLLKREVYGNYFAAVDLDNDYYNLEYPNKTQIIPREWIQQGIGATIPPTARNAVDNLADHILTTPHIFVPARPTNSEQQEEQDLAERKRQFLRSFWDQVKIQQGDPISHGKKKLIKDGRIVLKKSLRWDLIPDPPQEDASRKEKLAYRRDLKKLGESEFLWSIINCPTETIIEDPSDCYDPKYVYEFYKIYAGDARRMYEGMEDHLADYKDTDKVEYVKTDVAPIQGALSTVNSLNAVNFTWKKDGSRDFGFMAQELAKAIPQAVHGNEEGLYGVDYGRLTSVLVAAIQEQSAQIDALKAKLDK